MSQNWGQLQIFAETLQYRKTKSFTYMIDRTLYRPREIIQFCTDALDEGRKNGIVPIDYGIISTAELGYSSARAKDISAEYRFQYPGLESLFEVFRGLVYTLERADLEVICLGICAGEIKVSTEAQWVLNQDPDYLIDLLWRVGFLRPYAVGGLKALRRSGSSRINWLVAGAVLAALAPASGKADVVYTFFDATTPAQVDLSFALASH
ncbi:MAG TPA: hypothetical protein VH640_24545 [Bryobacteraceae bacterium]